MYFSESTEQASNLLENEDFSHLNHLKATREKTKCVENQPNSEFYSTFTKIVFTKTKDVFLYYEQNWSKEVYTQIKSTIIWQVIGDEFGN